MEAYRVAHEQHYCYAHKQYRDSVSFLVLQAVRPFACLFGTIVELSERRALSHGWVRVL